MVDDDHDEFSARKAYSTELMRLRERSGWTLAELSDRCKYDASYLQRLEKGDRLGSIDAAGVLDRVYDTGELLTRLWRLAKRETAANRYQEFMDLAAEARGFQEFSVSTVPGLLQTERYAEAQLRTSEMATDEIVREQLAIRMNRQDSLTGAKPVRYRGLLDESVIRRPTQDPELWTEQLERLIEAASLPNIALQIVPFGVGLHSLLGGSLTLLWLPSGRTAAYVESSWGGQLIDETEEVDELRLSYDRLRDSALSIAETLELLRKTLEEHKSCRPHR